MTNGQVEASAEPTTDPVAETVPTPEGDGGESASDFYDADRPPFEERPEKPKPPASAAPQAPPVGPLGSRELQVRAGAAVVGALLAVLLLRRRRRRHLSRRARRALSR